MTSLFDAYADTYREEVERAIAFARRDLDFFTRVKAEALLELTRDLIGDPERVRALDVGCGTGETDAHLEVFGDLHGVDVSRELVQRARARNPHATYAHYDGRTLPYEDGSFDLVFAICVLHHVPPEQWSAFVAELARVIRPGGFAAIVEHNPLNPLTRIVVARCSFDRDAQLVERRHAMALLVRSGLAPARERYIVFLPWRNGATRAAEHRLARLPLGAQYLVAARRAH